MARKVPGWIQAEEEEWRRGAEDGREFSGRTTIGRRAWWCKVGGTSPFPIETFETAGESWGIGVGPEDFSVQGCVDGRYRRDSSRRKVMIEETSIGISIYLGLWIALHYSEEFGRNMNTVVYVDLYRYSR